MDAGAWEATVHGVAESDMNERLHSLLPGQSNRVTGPWKVFLSLLLGRKVMTNLDSIETLLCQQRFV